MLHIIDQAKAKKPSRHLRGCLKGFYIIKSKQNHCFWAFRKENYKTKDNTE